MTTHQLILRTLGELREENPLMSQVTDVWYNRHGKVDKQLILVYKGSIYQTNIGWALYNVPAATRPTLLKGKFREILATITKHEEEGRFNRRRLDHLYPGLAS